MGHIQRTAVTAVLLTFDASLMNFARRVLQASSSTPICLRCQSRPFTNTARSRTRFDAHNLTRAFSTVQPRSKELVSTATDSKQTEGPDTTVQNATSIPSTSTPGSLPSSTETQRWPASRRLSKLMDELLAKASIAGQHINEYTGTDYTAIDALRREIGTQEQAVKDRIFATDAAKSRHHDAHSDQTSAQREIVGLLERKASWSPTDLERYMALVRSEHVNEQAVQAAKENLQNTERELEDARAVLERLERKRYHEEQIWSDTIRRNSTWVTFGLMGVNIILLLAQITIFEPYRRQKIVHDVKAALDEKTIAATVADPAASVTARPMQEAVVAAVNDSIDAVVSPEAKVKDDQSEQLLDPVLAHESVQEHFHEKATEQETSSVIAPAEVITAPNPDKASPSLTVVDEVRTRLRHYKSVVHDQFSDRVIQLRKIDLSTAVILSSMAGTLVTSLIFVTLRSAR